VRFPHSTRSWLLWSGLLAGYFVVGNGWQIPGAPSLFRAQNQAAPQDHLKLSSLSIEQLIDRLPQESNPGIGYQATAHAGGFLAAPGASNLNPPAAKSDKPANSPVMSELVRRGLLALPALLEHLEDKRPTQIVLKGNNLGSPLIMSNEYRGAQRSPDKRRPDKRPKGTVESFLEAGAIQEAPGIEAVNETQTSYTVKTGDLCFVLIGQIVNRPLNAARHQPTSITIVNSPVHVPALAQACRQDWSGLSAAQHRESLIHDCNAPGSAVGAIKRLLFYYPAEGETQLLRFLKRPFYDEKIVLEFIDDVLTSLSSLPSHQQELLENTKFYCEIIEDFQTRFNYLVSLYAPFEVDRFGNLFKLRLYEPESFYRAMVRKIVEQPLPADCKEQIAQFQKLHGNVCLAAVPGLLVDSIRGTGEATDIAYHARKFKADEILKAAFPGFDPTQPGFFNGVTVSEQKAFLEALGPQTLTSADEALYEIFQRLADAPNLLVSPNPEKHELARVCITRLLGKAHDAEFRAYLEKQIKDIQAHYNDQYRRIEKEEFALLEKMRK